MSKNGSKPGSAFGTVLGYAMGNVPAYSSDYDTVDNAALPNRSAFRSYLDDVYMGYKWQCVEFARRWLYINKGQVFEDVAMAYEIFRLTRIRDVKNNKDLPLYAFRNGSKHHPEVGSMLIWSEGGEFERTGHVAVIVEVLADSVRIAEQNLDHAPWPEGRGYSREIPSRITEDGGFWLRCSFNDASILGWVTQTEDASHAEKPEEPEPELFRIVPLHSNAKALQQSWLNPANPDEEAYIAAMGGHYLASREHDQSLYFIISKTAYEELERATNELHAMFMHATEYVLQNEKLWERFNIPNIVWPKIQQSWNNRRNQIITGRFDFAVNEQGIKTYEYNSDSASCHMEAGKIQGKWASASDCDIGEDPGRYLWRDLVEAWKESEVDDILHVMIDDNPEERYHGLFMKDALEAAGVPTRLLLGVDGTQWGEQGEVLDKDGIPIRWVWKSWAWETALDQIRVECEEDQVFATSPNPNTKHPPRLADILLRPEVMVFEPLWTLIPSNKAILPVIWELFANQRYLLNASYELTEELRTKGYVSKPIAGRCGANISLYDADNKLLDETDGQFGHVTNMFQELFPLPILESNSVQICTFTAGGLFAGACTRIDPTPIIKSNSDVNALRVVSDREFLTLLEAHRI